MHSNIFFFCFPYIYAASIGVGRECDVRERRCKLDSHWEGPYLVHRRMDRDDDTGVYQISGIVGREPPL